MYMYVNKVLNDAVRYKDLLDDAYADLSNMLKSKGDVCAIVYCLERSMCDELSAHLSQNGISCAGNYASFSFLCPCKLAHNNYQ